ncbi:MAG TPA: DUF5658 family protein [Bryobacteraceae bacterium]
MLLLTFIVLQVMDVLTTMVFLNLGVTEANPLIRFSLTQSGGHLGGTTLALVGPKLFAVALAILAWRSGRKRLLLKMDILFAVCVAWNLIVITTQL